ncbi:(2,3-dihydroxybenzoyl)adenylate synthase [Saccharopolyspora elongata]|uniref:(2,3-dihydroxybenzoyl)adenylate synthase n=1 Tax=Saccharopolyspora elongata TaxID=2530387 RepID=A0A4R4Y5P0_9PSEU|nr:AMP-binding protein [Saccharopolyspora elongata]TDD39556.1 (2,3-dihydroxybenzoyl)adenylate synthase [Saccharopolyspora elongata]
MTIRDQPTIPRIPEERAQRYRADGWWQPVTLDQLVLRHGDRVPSKCALVAGDRRMTYGELASSVDRAAALLATRGLRRGDAVVVQLPNSLEFVVLVLALMRIGALPMLILPALRGYEIERVLRLVRPRAMALPHRMPRFDHLAMVQELRPRHPYLETLLLTGEPPVGPDIVDLSELCDPASASARAAVPAHQPSARAEPHDAALLLLSSGTSGPPKMIARTHEDYGHVIRTASKTAGLDADSVYFAVMPAAHTFTLACPGILGTLAFGGRVVLGSAEDPRRTLRLIEQERVTHCAVVPALLGQWSTVLRSDHFDISSLAAVQVGGARLDPAGVEQARSVLGSVVQQVYGMTEGLVNSTRLDDPAEVVSSSQGRPVSAAEELLIVDDAGEPVPPGRTGQLLTRGPATIAGYYRDEAATENAFTADGFYRTGDLVRLLPSGNLAVVGRIKNVINRSGEKVCAEELEQLLRELDDIAEVAAVAGPHPMHGEIVCLYVVPAGEKLPELRELRQHLESRGLARYKLPERLQLLDAMPLIGVGKLDRAALREAAAAAERTRAERRSAHSKPGGGDLQEVAVEGVAPARRPQPLDT